MRPRPLTVVLVALLTLGSATADDTEAPEVIEPPDGFERLVAPEGEGNLFGYSVAMDGDRIVIGSPYSPANNSPMGAIFIFTRHGIGWDIDHINAEDAWTGSRAALAKRLRRFGYSVDVVGDRVVVGCPGDWVSGNESGAVYVYDLVDGEWQETRLAHPEIKPNNGVGYRVQMSEDGNRILAGSLQQGGMNFRGKAFLFEWDGETWQTRLFEASDGEKPDQFGRSIGLGEGFVVMGSPWHNHRRGAVYVYDERDGDWIETKIDPPDPVPGAYFGLGLSVHGDSVLIGSADEDTVYEMTRIDGTWVLDDISLSGEEPEAGVEIEEDYEPGGAWSPFEGDLLYVSDFGSDGPAKDPGAVRVLQEQGSEWTEINRYEGTDFGEGFAFGWDMALEGEVLVITAPLHKVDDVKAGAAYVRGIPPGCASYTATIVGTHGDDVIHGTPGDDVVFTGEGSDIIHLSGGSDVYCLNDGEYRFTGPVEFARFGDDDAQLLVTARPVPEWRMLVSE